MTTAERGPLASMFGPKDRSEWLTYTCIRCDFSVSAPTVDALIPQAAGHNQECAELQADSSAPGFSTRHAALYAAVNLSAAHTASEGRLSTGMVLRVAKVFEDYLAGRATSSGEEVGA